MTTEERELQRRVKELEEGLKAFIQVTDYLLDKDVQRVRSKTESLLFNSGAPKEKP